MAAAITRTQVYEAIKASKCPVPDFTTRVKTASIWDKKVYISLQGNQVSFVELNGFQNILRWLFGRYSDTIIKDPEAKATLERVKNYVNGILHSSEVLKGVETDLMPLPTTQADFCCLYDIVKALRDVEQNPNNQAILDEKLQSLFPRKNVPGNRNFSEGFIRAALQLIGKHLMIEEKLVGVLSTGGIPERTALNLALFRQIKGLGGVEEVACQGLPISDRIKAAIRDEVSRLMYSRDHSDVMQNQVTRNDYLRLEDWKATPCLPSKLCQQLYLEGETVDHDRRELFNRLVTRDADQTMVSIYVNDAASSDARLVYHSEMQAYRQLVIQEKIDEIKGAVLFEIEQQFTPKVPADQNKAETIANGGAGAEFVGSAMGALVNAGFNWAGYPNAGAVVGRTIQGAGGLVKGGANLVSKGIEYQNYERNIQEFLTGYLPVLQDERGLVSQIGWRARVVQAIADPKYIPLIEARIKKDTQTPEKVDDYLEWIKQLGAPIGMPELAVLSDISETAIIVVQKVDENYQWIGQFNFGFGKGPIVFNVDEEGILQPMELKTVKSSTPSVDANRVEYLDENAILV